jgi:4'-phosphopantetheinyl transferase
MELPPKLSPGATRGLLARLPPARRRVLARASPGRRLESLAGLWLLERAAGAALPAGGLGALSFPARGKPHWAGGADFSISHAGELVACAYSRVGRIGLDLELRARVRLAMLRRVLDATEQAEIAAGRLEAADAFVMKEAVVKASGAGLAALARVRLQGTRASLDGECWQLGAVALHPDYVAYLASEVPLAPSLERHAPCALEADRLAERA